MTRKGRLVRRAIVAALCLVAIPLVSSSCFLDATDGAGPSSGGTGGLGATCSCANSANECNGTTGGCNVGLKCVKNPTGSRSECTHECPCPFGFTCKAAGFVGGALLCFR